MRIHVYNIRVTTSISPLHRHSFSWRCSGVLGNGMCLSTVQCPVLSDWQKTNAYTQEWPKHASMCKDVMGMLKALDGWTHRDIVVVVRIPDIINSKCEACLCSYGNEERDNGYVERPWLWRERHWAWRFAPVTCLARNAVPYSWSFRMMFILSLLY